MKVVEKVADHPAHIPNYRILHWKTLIPLSFLNLPHGETKVSSTRNMSKKGSQLGKLGTLSFPPKKQLGPKF